MLKKQLHENPNLEQLKNQAKTLLKAHQSQSTDAIAQFKASHPEYANASDEAIANAEISLSDAQWVIAREHGFESWAKLKHYLVEKPQFYTIHLVGKHGDRTCARGYFHWQRTGSQLKMMSIGTSGGSPLRNPMAYTIQHLIGNPTKVILEFPIKVGKSWSAKVGIPAVGVKGWTASTVVKGIQEQVGIPAGIFSKCVHLVTPVTGQGKGEDGKPASESLEGVMRGERRFWFAPGDGLVKFQYEHADGSTTNIELLEYSPTRKSNDLFPLVSGNRWTYRWTNTQQEATVTERWVAAEGAQRELTAIEDLAFLHDARIDKANYTILCVDDNAPPLEVLSNLLQSEGYRVLTAENGERGMQVLNAEPVHLIISDVLMPGIDGLEFLRLSHKVRPGAAQILLATQADVNTTIKAINQGRISKFFLKPFDSAELLAAVGEIFTQQRIQESLKW